MPRGHGARASVRLHNDPDCAFARPTSTLSDEMMRIRSPKDFWARLIFIAIGGGFRLAARAAAAALAGFVSVPCSCRPKSGQFAGTCAREAEWKRYPISHSVWEWR